MIVSDQHATSRRRDKANSMVLTTAAGALWPAATRFRDLALDRCHAFLPDQEGPAGWCCGQTVEGGRGFLAESYCAQHRARFRARVPGQRIGQR
jgi:hypothetical protein